MDKQPAHIIPLRCFSFHKNNQASINAKQDKIHTLKEPFSIILHKEGFASCHNFLNMPSGMAGKYAIMGKNFYR
ncbi:MAG: hypothetical protein NC112_05475 [Oxalobacter formigenes]|nr:hypothetical protein [Oxalobacter formigenes]